MIVKAFLEGESTGDTTLNHPGREGPTSGNRLFFPTTVRGSRRQDPTFFVFPALLMAFRNSSGTAAGLHRTHHAAHAAGDMQATQTARTGHVTHGRHRSCSRHGGMGREDFPYMHPSIAAVMPWPWNTDAQRMVTLSYSYHTHMKLV